MRQRRPTWHLVLDAARQFSRSGQSPFALGALIEHVQRADPSRDRTSIQPIVQGMTANGGAGPQSPCGPVLERVSRGYYVLRDTQLPTASPTVRVRDARQRARLLSATETRNRLDALIADFDSWVDLYDTAIPFTRSGQYEFHRRTVDRRRELGSVARAIRDPEFIYLLHETLQRWGIGKRASRLVSLPEFHRLLRNVAPELAPLEHLTLETIDDGLLAVIDRLDRLISTLGIVDNRSLIVPGTKTLHHLLPDLVPPMDRAWTGVFFGWSSLDPQQYQSVIFVEAFTGFAEVARATQPSRLMGDGWRTSGSKVLDNALIGYCLSVGIGSPRRQP
jgi:hypothetical protein